MPYYRLSVVNAAERIASAVVVGVVGAVANGWSGAAVVVGEEGEREGEEDKQRAGLNVVGGDV